MMECAFRTSRFKPGQYSNGLNIILQKDLLFSQPHCNIFLFQPGARRIAKRTLRENEKVLAGARCINNISQSAKQRVSFPPSGRKIWCAAEFSNKCAREFNLNVGISTLPLGANTCN